MTKFVDNAWFVTETCCNCGMQFAMTEDFQRRRRNDHKYFYCPAGHQQFYNGPSETQKLKHELERKEQMLSAAQARAATAEQERLNISRAHKRMRERVMNGVCPCCNRTFPNLMRHMKSEHPDFSEVRTMLMMRKAFGMTQADVAREAGVDTFHVSLYERDKHVAPNVKQRLDNWLEIHSAADTQQEPSNV